MTTAQPGHEQQTDPTDRRLVASRYRLRARVGRGRLGEIHEADDVQHSDLAIERRVAIQLLPNRIARDRALFNKLKLGHTVLRAAPHPNIVPILDFGYDGRFGYLVTDLLEGASVRVVLDNAATLPLDEVLPIVRAVGDALQFLHAKSIVHGRLTAENVFVTEDLDVYLLDVVPLDSAISILGGVASGERSSRNDIADDVYGLACLTYEMLAGRHPFNYHDLSEAHRTGLKPARIDSLSEKQWNALCHALNFDSEQRTPAVADLLREFGITGTERLRPSLDDVANHESSAGHSVGAIPTTAQPEPSSSHSPGATPVSPATQTAPTVRHEDSLDPARAKGKLARRMSTFILAMLLVGLGAWYFYGQPRDDVAWLIDYVESFLDDATARQDEGGLPIIDSEISPPVSGNTEATAVPLSTAIRTEAGNDTRAGLADSNMTIEDTAISNVDTSASEEATTEPTDEQIVIAETTAVESIDDSTTDDFSSTAEADRSPQSDPRFTLMQSVVQVSEGGGSVQIANPLQANSTGRIFWWTADDTAIAENDYIPAERPIAAFASGDEAGTLHVPLVDDSIPEPRETFYVYLGRYNPKLERLETIARISVEINDDDFR
jgi:serine/threonine protein kinase